MKNLLILLLSLFAVSQMQAQKTLVTYYSHSGKTEKVAKIIAQELDAKLYKIEAEEPYTNDDLNWRNPNSRNSIESKDPNARPALADKKAKIKKYDIIYIGYPIWDNQCPRLINSFIEAYKFEGKKVFLFATSGGSTIDNSVKVLQKTYGEKLPISGSKLLNSDELTARNWAKGNKK